MKFNLYKALFFIIGGVLMVACGSKNQATKTLSSKHTDYKERIDSIINLMTVAEKVGQLTQFSVGAEMTGPSSKGDRAQKRYEMLLTGHVGSVLNLLGAENTYKLQKQVVEQSRLGIPLIFAYDVIHGYKTMFPIPLGESASWNLELMKLSAAVAAKESAAAGLQWTFAPMLDISVDPRWGRVMEGAGEDPFLGSQIAIARIKGFQGDDLSDFNTIAACAKHFAGYGFAEAGKDYNNVNINKYELLNRILPPFKIAAENNVATFMNAFNDLLGTPATANHYLLREKLKGEWGYDGAVVSDWNSIGEMVIHGTAKDLRQAAEHAILAGSDIDMEADAYPTYLEGLVSSGAVAESVVDEAVGRVLLLKYRLGLFEDPYKYMDAEREAKELLSDKNLDAALRVAEESIVLLKNENELLPLKNRTNIAVIGPLAKDKDSPLGNWRAAADAGSAVSFYEGLEAKIGKDVSITYSEGCKLSVGPNNFFQELEINNSDRTGFQEAIAVAKSAEVVFMVLGEPAYMSGEGRSRADIGLPGVQLDLLKAVYKVNHNIVLVLMNGRPMTLSWEDEHIPSILETWHLGSQAGHAIANVITGEVNPSGKLTMTFPRSVGQIPIYYNHKTTGRPTYAPGQVFFSHHTDIDKTPLYPFGFGLSYSTFKYSPIKLDKATLESDGDSIKVSVTIENTSNVAGKEIVQLYIQDDVATITRPVKELKAFKKLTFDANEQQTIDFYIKEADLSFYRKDFSLGTEAGTFKVFVGKDAQVKDFEAFNLVQ
jgi:beta-glucosidase